MSTHFNFMSTHVLFFSIGFVVWDLAIEEDKEGKARASLYPVAGFQHKDYHMYWHELIRRNLDGISIYEMLTPDDAHDRG